jgi:hypothetical protein
LKAIEGNDESDQRHGEPEAFHKTIAPLVGMAYMTVPSYWNRMGGARSLSGLNLAQLIWKLFRDPIGALTGIIPCRNYLQSGFAAKHANESADRMLLPSGQLLNFRQAHTLRPPQPRNYLGFLAG